MIQPTYILFFLVMASISSFAMMGLDKSAAKQGKRRISEISLWYVAVLGGGVGGTLGMYTFRHKTKHKAFAIGFPILATLQVGALGWFTLFM